MKVQIVENVQEQINASAQANQSRLHAHGIFSLNLIGSPGCGKTALLENTLRNLFGTLRTAVLVGDVATTRDGERLAAVCDQVVQVNTGKLCHLEAQHVQQGLDKLRLEEVDVLFIENVGNLICPVQFDLGQDVMVGVMSVTEGDDKAAKYPHLVQEADLLLLNKTDLMPFVKFDVKLFKGDVKKLNPQVKLLEVSATTGQGMEGWLQWIKAGHKKVRG